MTQAPSPKDLYIARATALFAEHGFHGVSLAGLAKTSGVTKQALLHFFGTKEGLYAEVLQALAERLMQDLEAHADQPPDAHLEAYFLGFQKSAREDASDVKLVVRALLDSEAEAKKWPLKPYLDRLIDIAQSTDGGASASQAETLAWLSKMIGGIQYQAISATAVTGMYGAKTIHAMTLSFEEMVRRDVANFARGA